MKRDYDDCLYSTDKDSVTTINRLAKLEKIINMLNLFCSFFTFKKNIIPVLDCISNKTFNPARNLVQMDIQA